jgi:hypothetical protein
MTPLVNEIIYYNTIAGSPPGKQLFIYFEKRRYTSQKLNFSKKIAKNSKNDPK